jgi:hypothetical protein
MPFKNDPRGGGTNADGTTSKIYCSYCYEKGKFTQPDWSAAQMQGFVKGKLREMGGIHRLFAGIFLKEFLNSKDGNIITKKFKK